MKMMYSKDQNTWENLEGRFQRDNNYKYLEELKRKMSTYEFQGIIKEFVDKNDKLIKQLLNQDNCETIKTLDNLVSDYRKDVKRLKEEKIDIIDERDDLEVLLNEYIGENARLKKASKNISIFKLISSKISNSYKSIRNRIYKHLVSKLNNEGVNKND